MVLSVVFVGIKAARADTFSFINQLSSTNNTPVEPSIFDGPYIYASSAVPVPTPKPAIRVLGNSAAPTTKRVFLPGDAIPRIAGQCALWVRYYADVDFTGNARDWVKYANTTTPEVGDIIILNLSRYGHVGIIISIDEGVITYRSRNNGTLWVVSDNEINTGDIRILGYINTDGY